MRTRYVIDVNVLFSALISGKELYVEAFTRFQFLLPDFALQELQHYQTLILQKTKLSKAFLQDYTLRLFEYITVVPNLLISTQSYWQAFELCKDIDKKDLTYIALAIEFDLFFITKDQILIDGLQNKGFHQVMSLQDFLEKLG